MIHSGDDAGEPRNADPSYINNVINTAAAGASSRDLAALALYDAGLLRPPASVGDRYDPAKATGVLLVEARPPPRRALDPRQQEQQQQQEQHEQQQQEQQEGPQQGQREGGQSDTDGDEAADLRHWTLGGASWILLDNSSEENVLKSAEYLHHILANRMHPNANGGGAANDSGGPGAAMKAGGNGEQQEVKKKRLNAGGVAAAAADDAKQFLEHYDPKPTPPASGSEPDGGGTDGGGTDGGANGRRFLTVGAPGLLAIPTVVVAHLPLFTQYCGGADSQEECAEMVRIGSLCVHHWLPLLDSLGVDLVISHHAVGYQRGRVRCPTQIIVFILKTTIHC